MKRKFKKEHLLVSAIVLFAFIAATPLFIWNDSLAGAGVKLISCVDSEGEDYFTFGKITLKYSHKNGISTKEYYDVCVNDNVEEYICVGNTQKKIQYKCEHGCSNGACILSICTDSDYGKDYNTKGVAIFEGKIDESKIDYCLNDKKLSEYFCDGQEEVRAVEYTCPQGCSNGVCIGSSNGKTSCEDSDKGVDYHTRGEITTSSGRTEGDSCKGIKLAEYYCTSDGVAMMEYYTCPDGCEEGACI